MEKKLTLTAALATALAGLSGCSDGDDLDYRAASNTRVCVDDWGQRIADQYCEQRGRVGGGSFVYLRAGSPIPYYYDNIRDKRYASYVSRTPPVGFVDAAPAATNMSRSSAISRGGLGSSSRSFGRGG
jgi:hypothetical protein